MSFRLIIILLLSICGSLSVVADTHVDYYLLAEKADKSIKDGKWSEAEDYIRQAMRLEPSNPSNVLLLSNLGMIQFYDGRTADALSTLSHAHDIAPASVTVLQNRARVYTSLSQTEKAIADYDKVIRLDSTLVEPRFYRALLALNNGDLVTAQKGVDALSAMAPNHRLTHVASATLLMHTGYYAEAILHLSTAIKEDANASYYSSRALCRLQIGDIGGASEDIANGLDLDPTDGELYLYRALLNKMRYRASDAEADGKLAVKFGVSPERVKILLQ